MSSNVKIIAALLGCVALAFLWFGRGGDSAPSQERPERVRPTASSVERPKRRMLLDQPMVRDELDDAERRRPGKMKSQLEARSKKVKERRAMRRQRPPTPDPAERDMEDQEDFEHWRDVALNDPDPDERVDALTQLDFDQPDALGVLAQALRDPEADVRLSALDELWVNTDEPPLDILGPVLDDPDPEVRAEAVRMIAESEDPEAEALLEGATTDPDEDVRGEAADALDIDEDEP